ncbi:hypothetical protein U1Q18_008478 [Sarracenia purpurea var. burkii]
MEEVASGLVEERIKGLENAVSVSSTVMMAMDERTEGRPRGGGGNDNVGGEERGKKMGNLRLQNVGKRK